MDEIIKAIMYIMSIAVGVVPVFYMWRCGIYPFGSDGNESQLQNPPRATQRPIPPRPADPPPSANRPRDPRPIRQSTPTQSARDIETELNNIGGEA